MDRSTQNKVAREDRGDSRGGAKGGAYSRNVRGHHGKLSRQVRSRKRVWWPPACWCTYAVSGWQSRDLDREIAASAQISKPSTGSAKVAPRSAWRWSASTAAP